MESLIEEESDSTVSLTVSPREQDEVDEPIFKNISEIEELKDHINLQSSQLNSFLSQSQNHENERQRKDSSSSTSIPEFDKNTAPWKFKCSARCPLLIIYDSRVNKFEREIVSLTSGIKEKKTQVLKLLKENENLNKSLLMFFEKKIRESTSTKDTFFMKNELSNLSERFELLRRENKHLTDENVNLNNKFAKILDNFEKQKKNYKGDLMDSHKVQNLLERSRKQVFSFLKFKQEVNLRISEIQKKNFDNLKQIKNLNQLIENHNFKKELKLYPGIRNKNIEINKFKNQFYINNLEIEKILKIKNSILDQNERINQRIEGFQVNEEEILTKIKNLDFDFTKKQKKIDETKKDSDLINKEIDLINFEITNEKKKQKKVIKEKQIMKIQNLKNKRKKKEIEILNKFSELQRLQLNFEKINREKCHFQKIEKTLLKNLDFSNKVIGFEKNTVRNKENEGMRGKDNLIDKLFNRLENLKKEKNELSHNFENLRTRQEKFIKHLKGIGNKVTTKLNLKVIEEKERKKKTELIDERNLNLEEEIKNLKENNINLINNFNTLEEKYVLEIKKNKNLEKIKKLESELFEKEIKISELKEDINILSKKCKFENEKIIENNKGNELNFSKKIEELKNENNLLKKKN